MTGTVDPAGIAIHLNTPARGWEDQVPAEEIRRGVELVLREEEVREGEVSITFVDSKTIEEMNRRYLGHAWATDVLSFPLNDPGTPLLGDIYIGIEVADRQAAELGVSLSEELVRLAVHSALHLTGYDHPEGEGRAESKLFQKQESVVRRITG